MFIDDGLVVFVVFDFDWCVRYYGDIEWWEFVVLYFGVVMELLGFFFGGIGGSVGWCGKCSVLMWIGWFFVDY